MKLKFFEEVKLNEAGFLTRQNDRLANKYDSKKAASEIKAKIEEAISESIYSKNISIILNGTEIIFKVSGGILSGINLSANKNESSDIYISYNKAGLITEKEKLNSDYNIDEIFNNIVASIPQIKENKIFLHEEVINEGPIGDLFGKIASNIRDNQKTGHNASSAEESEKGLINNLKTKLENKFKNDADVKITNKDLNYNLSLYPKKEFLFKLTFTFDGNLSEDNRFKNILIEDWLGNTISYANMEELFKSLNNCFKVKIQEPEVVSQDHDKQVGNEVSDNGTETTNQQNSEQETNSNTTQDTPDSSNTAVNGKYEAKLSPDILNILRGKSEELSLNENNTYAAKNYDSAFKACKNEQDKLILVKIWLDQELKIDLDKAFEDVDDYTKLVLNEIIIPNTANAFNSNSKAGFVLARAYKDTGKISKVLIRTIGKLFKDGTLTKSFPLDDKRSVLIFKTLCNVIKSQYTWEDGVKLLTGGSKPFEFTNWIQEQENKQIAEGKTLKDQFNELVKEDPLKAKELISTDDSFWNAIGKISQKTTLKAILQRIFLFDSGSGDYYFRKPDLIEKLKRCVDGTTQITSTEPSTPKVKASQKDVDKALKDAGFSNIKEVTNSNFSKLFDLDKLSDKQKQDLLAILVKVLKNK